jgi:hypothetical protein
MNRGSNWLPSVRVADLSRRDAEESWMGDTAGLVADASEAFHPLWIDNRIGLKQVFAALVVVK